MQRKYTDGELTAGEIFGKHGGVSPKYSRGLILKNNLLEYKCQLCMMNSVWNGKELKFQLDHKNGIRTDNRLENLRWLCPNCHSQTETYCGANIGNLGQIKVSEETLCDALRSSHNIREALIKVGLDNGRNYSRAKKILDKHNIHFLPKIIMSKNENEQKNLIEKSVKVSKKLSDPLWRSRPKPHLRKVKRPSKEKLISLYAEHKNWTILGEKFGVSDNAVRKWFKYYDLDVPKDGNRGRKMRGKNSD